MMTEEAGGGKGRERPWQATAMFTQWPEVADEPEVTAAASLLSAVVGLVLGAGAVGGVLGALVTWRLAVRIGVGWAYTIGCVVYTAPLALVPLAAGPEPVILAMLFAAEFCSGFGVMILDISIGAIFAAVIPDQLRSRVSGAFQAVNYGTRPIGALAGGTLGSLIGIRPTLWIAAVGGMTGVLWLLPTSVPRCRMPDTTASDNVAPASEAGPGPSTDPDESRVS